MDELRRRLERTLKAEVNPVMFWERYVVPQKIAATAHPSEKEWPAYITFDPTIADVPDENEELFSIEERSTHDGNIQNTYEMIWRVFQHIVFMKVLAKKYEGRKDFNAITYRMGYIMVENDIDGSLILPSGKRERGNIEIARIRAIGTPRMQH